MTMVFNGMKGSSQPWHPNQQYIWNRTTNFYDLAYVNDFSPHYLDNYFNIGPDLPAVPWSEWIGWVDADLLVCGTNPRPYALSNFAGGIPAVGDPRGLAVSILHKDATSLAHIDAALLAGRPTIITRRICASQLDPNNSLNVPGKKPCQEGAHANVIVGWNNFTKKYVIYDPAWGTGVSQLAGDGFEQKTVDERYQAYMGSIKTIVLTKKALFSPFWLFVRDDPEPIKLRLTDEAGRRTGYDPETGENLHETEDAFYDEATSFADPLNVYPESDPHRYIAAMDPAPGGYALEVFGIGDGPYVLEVGTSDGWDENIAATLEGEITNRGVARYEIFLEPNGAVTVDEVSAFDPRAKAGNDASTFLGGQVSFDGRGSYQIGGTLASHVWNYGDGVIEDGAEQLHTYASAGIFTATLTVTDEDGLVGTDERIVTVIDPASLPQMETLRVSVGANGEEGTGTSGLPEITPEGRWVAFISQAPNLVPGDDNAILDVFVKDLSDGSIDRVNVGPNGEEDDAGAPFGGYGASITPDGNLVAFLSGATNFYAGDVLGGDVFVRDLAAQTTEVIAPGSQANGSVSLSDDGRWVAFDALADLDPTDVDSAYDVYLYDRQTTALTCVSCEGSGGGTVAFGAKISGDGTTVAFQTTIGTFPGDVNGTLWDVYAYDRLSGILELVSADAAGNGFPGAQSRSPTISANGRYVAFESQYPFAAPGDNNGPFDEDVFVRDRGLGTVERISVSSTNEGANAQARCGDVSSDGRFVAFLSYADNLAPSGTSTMQAYVRDRQDGTTTRVSVDDNYVEANPPLIIGTVSGGFVATVADDGAVAFNTLATNLVVGDGNGVNDVFLRRLDPATAPVSTPLANLKGPYAGWATGEAVPAGVLLDASESVDPLGRPLTAQWDFGDGSPILDGGLTTNHAYTTAGKYTVTVTVSADLDMSDPVTTEVEVFPALQVDSLSGLGCASPGQSVELIGSAPSNHATLIAEGWDTTAGPIPLVPTTVDTPWGELTAPTVLPGLTFRIGTTVPAGFAEGSYDASAVGVEAPFVVPCKPRANQLPYAVAGGPIYETTVGVPVTLDGSDSFDPEGEPLTHAWAFGDGTTGEGALADHVYDREGDFMVKLVVSDGAEASSPEIGSNCFAMVKVGPAAPDEPPPDDPPPADDDDSGADGADGAPGDSADSGCDCDCAMRPQEPTRAWIGGALALLFLARRRARRAPAAQGA